MKRSIILVLAVLLVGSGSLETAQKEPVKTPPLPPAEAAKTFTVSEGLEIQQVLAEPDVKQPVFVTFDQRGRMWVVQYLQYPSPAGIKLMSRDKYWRAVYDKIPPPPPHHFRGKDKITIHEDTDGDGRFDKHTTFVEGLNITTAVALGRGGVWVLNPPYLLFYPDRNGDDVPDGDPEVHLQGFGLEDTHSVVNNLRWGPDGWLYAAQGSTVSASAGRPGDKTVVPSMGQLIWRYHPESRRYEIFAEGGGNAFGVEIDSKGRVYSGHNGGDTRGFHYVQGGYYQKGFTKHGPISNPYAFGYFPWMKHARVPRFSHTFVLYEGGSLPDRYAGKLFAIDPLKGTVVLSEISPDGSSFQTKDLEKALASSDGWFRPVHIALGPDGALYVADWYDAHISHLKHNEGQVAPENGRIYRLQNTSAKSHRTTDLGRLSTAKLVNLSDHENRWYRETALRLLADRKDKSAIPSLVKRLGENSGQLALEALWALNLCGGFDDTIAARGLGHADPYVRLWTVRLLGDRGTVTNEQAAKLVYLAGKESHLEVRSQLACSARRLPAQVTTAVVRQLVTRHEDSSDVHIPLLLWWALEAKAESDRDVVLGLFEDSSFWRLPMVQTHILERVMRRYAQAGTRKNLLTCARLLELAPSPDHSKRLLAGFEQALAGRSLANLPPELIKALSRHGGGSLTLRIRLGEPDAVEKGLQIIADRKADPKTRVSLVQTLGEVKEVRAVPALLKVLEENQASLAQAALGALQAHDDPHIARRVIELHDSLPLEARSMAQALLSSRKEWARLLVQAVQADKIKKESVSVDTVRRLTLHRDDRLVELATKLFGKVQGATTAEMQQKIRTLQATIPTSAGSPYAGKKLFLASCGKCHTLFGQGGFIGPDLTSYKRDDLGTMLLHIVNPSAEIREGFETYFVATDDGRALTGFLFDQDNQIVVLRTAEGQDINVARDKIEEMKVIPQSLMPEALLDSLTEQQVRDLFAYLRSTQPLND